jgi:hypothetical protein
LPERKDLPITKRFPGQHIMRSTIWYPAKDEPGKYSFKLGYEGSLHPEIAKAIVALQLHQRNVTPAMIKQLNAMTKALNPPSPKSDSASVHED